MTARPARLGAGVVAIGLALMMILLLDGLWAGVQERATTYEDNLGAQLVVVAQFVASESAVVGDMSADLLTLMDLVAYLIALAVIALGLMTSTLDRLRDYGVLKALGAPTHRLAGTVASQVLWITGLAVAVATVLAVILSTLVPLLAPTVELSVTAGSVASAALGALAAGLAGALLPVWRLARVDAATAFRSTR